MRHVRNLLFFAVGLLIGGFFTYATAASYSSGGTANWGAGYKWQGNGTISGGTANTIESINVGGKYVAVPYAGPIAAAAIETAILAARASPQAIVGGLFINWLVSKGISLIDGQWMAQGESQPINTEPDASSSSCPSGNMVSGCPENSGCYINDTIFKTVSTGELSAYTSSGWQYVNNCSQRHVVIKGKSDYVPPAPCNNGYHVSSGVCVPDAYTPAGQSDWDKVLGVTPPDAVMEDLCRQAKKLGVPCGANGVLGQTTTTPLSDYATDPVTGKQTRQVATLTPSPTESDPTRVKVDVYNQEKTVTSNGDGTTTESTENKPDNTDFCVLHPNSLACMEGGEPEDVELKKEERPFAVTPQSGFGADSGTCPADRVYVTRSGVELRSSWSPVCQMATTFRPIVLGMAWIVAAMLAMGVSRRNT